MNINQTINETLDCIYGNIQQGHPADALIATPNVIQAYLLHLAQHDLPGIDDYAKESARINWAMAGMNEPNVVKQVNHDADALFFALDYSFDDYGVLHFDLNSPRNWDTLLKAVDHTGVKTLQTFAHTLAQHSDSIPFSTAWAVISGAVYHELALYSLFN